MAVATVAVAAMAAMAALAAAAAVATTTVVTAVATPVVMVTALRTGTRHGTPRHATSEKHLTIFGLGPLGLAWAPDHIFRPLLQPIDVNDRNLILKRALG